MKCITIDDDIVTRKLLAKYISQTDSLLDVGQFADSIEAINFLQTTAEDVDLIFLDIQMPAMDGFEFLNLLETTPQVVVISASPEYALRAFDYGATDYLLKPISYSRFYQAVSKTMRWTQPAHLDDELFLKRDNSLVRVPFQSILWVEAMENYVVLYTDEERFILHFTLKSIVSQMPSALFRQIHRSYIVNISRIESIDEDSNVVLRRKGEEIRLPIGKRYRDRLMSSLRFFSR